MDEEFKKYVLTFDINEPSINRKYHHSKRVKNICNVLATNLKMTKNEIKLAEVIGLLHDYGRFYQWQTYKTFNDRTSIDHADYGVIELFDKKQIQKYWTEEKDYTLIYDAIKYHNKYKLPDDIKNSIEMCKIIRDADKIDILYIYASGELKLEESGVISENIKEDFYKHKLIKYEDRHSKIDATINTLSLIYDFNYKESFRYIYDKQIIKTIYDNIENKEKLKPYFDEINRFINNKLFM